MVSRVLAQVRAWAMMYKVVVQMVRPKYVNVVAESRGSKLTFIET